MQQLLSYNDLKAFGIPYSKSHLYYLMNRDEFPRPVKLSANTVAWDRDDVQMWIDEKIKSHRISENQEAGVMYGE
jgi:prophage regulatory protein